MAKIVVAILIMALILTGLFHAGFIGIDLLAFLLFVSAVGGIFYADRKKMKREGIVFMRRTHRGRQFIDRVASSNRSFWNFFSYAGIFVGIIAMISIVLLLAVSGYQIITKEAGAGGAGIVLPGPVSSPVAVPGIFVVPWWIWIIGIIAVVVPHEFMHGVMCRLEKIKISSVGWAFFLFIPAAFVEPDEKQLAKAPSTVRMKVYAAGSFANLTMAAIILVVLTMIAGMFVPAGMHFQVVEDSPAHEASLSGAITFIDGVVVRSNEDILQILSEKSPGDAVSVKTVNLRNRDGLPVFSGGMIPEPGVLIGDEEKIMTVTLGENQGKAYMGVFVTNSVKAYNTSLSDIFILLYTVMFWVYTFSFGIGLFNLLPMKPLDGGPFFQELAGKFTSRADVITKHVSILMLLLVLFNLFGVYIV